MYTPPAVACIADVVWGEGGVGRAAHPFLPSPPQNRTFYTDYTSCIVLQLKLALPTSVSGVISPKAAMNSIF